VRRTTNSGGNCYRLPIWQRSVWKRQRGRSVCIPCLVPTPRALENRPKGSVFMIRPRSADSGRAQRASAQSFECAVTPCVLVLVPWVRRNVFAAFMVSWNVRSHGSSNSVSEEPTASVFVVGGVTKLNLVEEWLTE